MMMRNMKNCVYVEGKQRRKQKTKKRDDTTKFVIRLFAAFIVCVLSIIALGMWGCPNYDVWQQNLKGKAELARATQNRQITIQEALAKRESAKELAQAEIERAKGVAEANKIIGEGLRGHEEYLRYLWIMSIEHTASSVNGSTVVYIPTEANLPILEASRSTLLNTTSPVLPTAFPVNP